MSESGQKPNIVLTAWPVKLAIWSTGDNETQRMTHSCKLEKSYKKDGAYHTTTSLFGDDLLKAAALFQEAYNITQIEIQRS